MPPLTFQCTLFTSSFQDFTLCLPILAKDKKEHFQPIVFLTITSKDYTEQWMECPASKEEFNNKNLSLSWKKDSKKIQYKMRASSNTSKMNQNMGINLVFGDLQ